MRLLLVLSVLLAYDALYMPQSASIVQPEVQYLKALTMRSIGSRNM